MRKNFVKAIFLFLVFAFSNLANAAIVNVSIGGLSFWDSDYSIHPISMSFSYDTSSPSREINWGSHRISYQMLDFNLNVGKDLGIDGFENKYAYITLYEESGYLDPTMLAIVHMSSLGDVNFMSFTSFYYHPSPWANNFDGYVLDGEEISKIFKTEWQSDTMWATYTGKYFGDILDSSYNIHFDPSTLVISYQNNIVSEPAFFWLFGLGIVLVFSLRRSGRRNFRMAINV